MLNPGKVIVQFRKNGKRVTTKTVGSATEAMSDFDAVMAAEGILQQLADSRQIPQTLLDYDTIRLNNARDITVTATGRNKGALSILAGNKAVLSGAQSYLKTRAPA